MDNQNFTKDSGSQLYDGSITVRRAKIEDLDAVIELAGETIVYSISPYRNIIPELAKTYRKNDLHTLHQMFDSPNLGVFIAETLEGVFVGHIIMVVNLTDSLTGEIISMVVDLSVKKEYWGSKAAELLCQQAEVFARENRMQYVELGVTTSNKRALRFYEKMGYMEERKRMIKQI